MVPKYNFKQLYEFAEKNKNFKTTRVFKNALLSAMFKAQGVIANTYLSASGRAPEPSPYTDKLRVDTGRLRADFLGNTPRVSKKGGKIVGSMGTNVEYAAVHEFGFSGQVTVRAHWRTIKTAFGRKIAPRSTFIQAFTRQMNMPARSPFKHGLQASRTAMSEIVVEMITTEMQRAIGYYRK